MSETSSDTNYTNKRLKTSSSETTRHDDDEDQNWVNNLPEPFVRFLRENDISIEIYQTHENLPRYARIVQYHPDHYTKEYAQKIVKGLRDQMKCGVELVQSFPSFLKLDHNCGPLSQSQVYLDCNVLGMSLSSAIPVYALDIQPNDHILDLCSAPGTKMLLMCESLIKAWREQSPLPYKEPKSHLDCADEYGNGTVTAVEIEKHRAESCRSRIKKANFVVSSRVRLYNTDGTRFNVPPPNKDWWDVKAMRRWKEEGRELSKDKDTKRLPGSKAINSFVKSTNISQLPWYSPKPLRSEFSLGNNGLYDKVIVDAECTHDASLPHIKKYKDWGWDKLATQVVNPDRIKEICNLQIRLLENGWRLLAPGGIIVYSTCTFAAAQNEQIVWWFLKRHPKEAVLEPIPCVENIPYMMPKLPPGIDPDDASGVLGKLKHCVRLDPRVSDTKGMFVARIRKVSTD
ncbi:hypothetical protein H4219_002685 [Mycoemilia scoparia]|uniref:SAM-dependent MTase RsmB/NOP-type domain-containing protein n=1 Tax=Mycoemilia scoparia TaxID=417184 RepID=A0A9W8A1W4_9FUNG|nr:hypothetical protein H4219_002685 [Mycoemilia scoparia]